MAEYPIRAGPAATKVMNAIVKELKIFSPESAPRITATIRKRC